MLGRFGLFWALALLTGCASFTSSIMPDHQRDPASAYIYGRFRLRNPKGEGGGTMGFEVRCRDGSIYTIGMAEREKDALQVIKVAPSVCQIEEFVYESGGAIQGRRMATFRLLHNEFLNPGGVYYVGDFVAASRYSSDFHLLYTEQHFAWALTSIRNDYVDTTREMKRRFPSFSGVATEDRM